MVVAADYPLLDVVWTMFVFFGFVIWMWMLFVVFGDIFRRHDIGGWAKAGWSVLLIFFPLLGGVFCGFVIWMWMLFVVFGDIFRRHDIGGWAKAGWSVLIIFFPLLGVLIYMI